MKPSKRKLWREVARLDEELPPARDPDAEDGQSTEEVVAELEALFEDDEDALERAAEKADELF